MGKFFSTRENNSISVAIVRLSTANLRVIAGFHCHAIENKIPARLGYARGCNDSFPTLGVS